MAEQRPAKETPEPSIYCARPDRICPFDHHTSALLVRLENSLFGNGKTGLIHRVDLFEIHLEHQINGLTKAIESNAKKIEEIQSIWKRLNWLLISTIVILLISLAFNILTNHQLPAPIGP